MSRPNCSPRRAAAPRTRAPPSTARSPRSPWATTRPQRSWIGTWARGREIAGRQPVAHRALRPRHRQGESSGAHARARTTPRTPLGPRQAIGEASARQVSARSKRIPDGDQILPGAVRARGRGRSGRAEVSRRPAARRRPRLESRRTWTTISRAGAAPAAASATTCGRRRTVDGRPEQRRPRSRGRTQRPAGSTRGQAPAAVPPSRSRRPAGQ